MPTTEVGAPSSRSTLVAEIRQRLADETFPRLIVLVMLVVAGAASFLCSVLALDAGLESMAPRYALSTASGYLVFLLLIRVWIAIRRGWSMDGADADLADAVELPRSSTSARSHDSVVDAASHGFDWSFDLDDAWWLALVVLAVAAGLVAVVSVVAAAPVLLAEVALDAALIGTAYRRLRREERRYWATTALRQTWMWAVVLVAFMTVLGFGLQQLAPEGVSIGDVIRRSLAR